ncbi:peptidase inhibitor family I36 protein [Embleya sp. NPDC055664]
MRLRYLLASTVLAGAAVVGQAPSAQAAPPSPRCLLHGSATRAFCYFYNSNQQGGVAGWDLTYADGVGNLAGYEFALGAGTGLPVKNNAASATYQVAGSCTGYALSYYLSNYAGPADFIFACTGENLVETYNQNASFKRWTS